MGGSDVQETRGNTTRQEAGRLHRAVERRNWPVAVHGLGDEPSDDLSATTTPEERLSMVWALTRDAWALAGREIPAYSRSEMPVVVIHDYRRRQREELIANKRASGRTKDLADVEVLEQQRPSG
jgi:hypothetical protein